MWQREFGLIKKWSMILIGGTLIVLGLVTFWLPLPIGIPLMLVGATVLLRYSPLARAWWSRHRHRLGEIWRKTD